MRASEKLAERNDILEVITQIDDDLKGLGEEKTLRNAQLARELLSTRAELAGELNKLGFSAPTLDERLQARVHTSSAHPAGRNRLVGGSESGRVGTVARRRIGPGAG